VSFWARLSVAAEVQQGQSGSWRFRAPWGVTSCGGSSTLFLIAVSSPPSRCDHVPDEVADRCGSLRRGQRRSSRQASRIGVVLNSCGRLGDEVSGAAGARAER